MKQLITDMARNIPRELKNYHIIKRQDIYIPYCEMGGYLFNKRSDRN